MGVVCKWVWFGRGRSFQAGVAALRISQRVFVKKALRRQLVLFQYEPFPRALEAPNLLSERRQDLPKRDPEFLLWQISGRCGHSFLLPFHPGLPRHHTTLYTMEGHSYRDTAHNNVPCSGRLLHGLQLYNGEHKLLCFPLKEVGDREQSRLHRF